MTPGSAWLKLALLGSGVGRWVGCGSRRPAAPAS